MITIKKEILLPEDRDELSAMREEFKLLTLSYVRKIAGFEKQELGIVDGFNVYIFTPSVQMSRRNSP